MFFICKCFSFFVYALFICFIFLFFVFLILSCFIAHRPRCTALASDCSTTAMPRTQTRASRLVGHLLVVLRRQASQGLPALFANLVEHCLAFLTASRRCTDAFAGMKSYRLLWRSYDFEHLHRGSGLDARLDAPLSRIEPLMPIWTHPYRGSGRWVQHPLNKLFMILGTPVEDETCDAHWRQPYR